MPVPNVIWIIAQFGWHARDVTARLLAKWFCFGKRAVGTLRILGTDEMRASSRPERGVGQNLAIVVRRRSPMAAEGRVVCAKRRWVGEIGQGHCLIHCINFEKVAVLFLITRGGELVIDRQNLGSRKSWLAHEQMLLAQDTSIRK